MTTSLMRRSSVGTNYTAFDPFQTVDEVQSRMWDWLTTPPGHTPLDRLFGEPRRHIPPIDVYETSDNVFIIASLPGIDISKVNVQAVESTVTISGEQKPFRPQNEGERVVAHVASIPRYGAFSFSINVPAAVDVDQTEAKYHDGLLWLRLGKPQATKPRTIPVQTAEVQTAADEPVSDEAQSQNRIAANGRSKA